MPVSRFTMEELPPLRLYRQLQANEQLVVFADPAESHDYCAAVAISKKFYDCPIVFNMVMESSQFGYELYYLCKYIYNQTSIWPKLAVERNVGQATIYVLKELNYPDLFRMVDFSASSTQERGGIGWVTSGGMSGGQITGTRRKMLDDLAVAVRQRMIKMYDEEQIRQLMAFMIGKGGRAEAKRNEHDDITMATAGAWQVQMLTPVYDFGGFDQDQRDRERDKWRFR